MATISTVLPAINSSGYYKLKTPLDILIQINEQYKCIAIRNISDYLAANEDPEKDIYENYGISEHYINDANNDEYIVCLQNDVGYRIQVPNSFILSYPITNGIVYRSFMIGLSLPSLPVDVALDQLTEDLSNSVIASLGVKPLIKIVETSRPMMVQSEEHIVTASNRNILKITNGTDKAKYQTLLVNHNAALDKIAELERYIKSKYV